MLCQKLASILQSTVQQLSSGIITGLDVFSWVILWRPLDELIFSWNPHLKEISIEDRLANAEVILVKYEE